MSVHLDPIEWAAGPAYPDGWEGFVPGLELQGHNRIADALRGTAGLLNGLSARIEDEVLEFLPAGHPVRAALAAETRRMLDQALTLVDPGRPCRPRRDRRRTGRVLVNEDGADHTAGLRPDGPAQPQAGALSLLDCVVIQVLGRSASMITTA